MGRAAPRGPSSVRLENGSYGAGLQALMDEEGWSNRSDGAADDLDGAAVLMAATPEGAGARDDFAEQPSGRRSGRADPG